MRVVSRPSRALDEKRVLDYLEDQLVLSETPSSLSNKVGVDSRTVRRVLDHLVEEGRLRRRDLGNAEPIYYRFPAAPRG